MKDKNVKQNGFYKALGVSLFIITLILGVILLGLIITKDKSMMDSSSMEGGKSHASTSSEGRLVLGDSDAEILIVEYSDFECPFCQRFYSQTYGQIIENYVETGKVKFVYKHFPLTNIHPNALTAGIAYECAVEQGMGSEYHDKVFEASSLSVTTLKSISVELGLDTDDFDNCLDSKKYEQTVLDDLSEGQKLGVTGTPTLFVGDVKIVGAQPFSVFKKEIDEQLAALN